MQPKQLSFLPRPLRDHGGDLRKGKRKSARPFSPKLPLHVVLRSARASGEWSMLHPRHAGKVAETVRQLAERHHVKVYRLVNVGNHLHLLVIAKKKRFFQSFLRALTGAIAFLITGTRKGRKLSAPFWEKLAYSRLVSWGREWETVKRYFVKNMFEAAGLWNRKRDPDLKLIWLSMAEAGVGPPG